MPSTGSRPFNHRISGSLKHERRSFTYSIEAEDDARSVFESSGESEDLLENTEAIEERRELRQPETAGAIFVRGVALLCACSLSIGSH